MPKTLAASRGASSFSTIDLRRIRRISHIESPNQYVYIRLGKCFAQALGPPPSYSVHEWKQGYRSTLRATNMTSKLNLQGRVPFVIWVYARLFVEKLTSEEVRKTVHLFWTTFLAKSEDVLNSYYASASSVFQISMARSEPGRLGAMRRSREYFPPDTRMDLKLGPIEIALIGGEAAVATYTFQFQATGRDLGGG